ncbi:putative glutathione S-transferase [Xylogone sp. PMI_703]|nr:putative glutathione S-transferase [Xylogone sp. PMI_703]
MASSDRVHFFDITCLKSGPAKSWSPNTLKTRLVLNYKRIPYTQSFISYPDIVPVLKALSIEHPPEGVYTLPAIIHQPSITWNPSGAMYDSFPIAAHLENVFAAPEYPSIFPFGDPSYSISIAVDSLIPRALIASLTLIIPKVPEILDDRGREYFHITRSKRFGKPLEEVSPQTEEAVEEIRGNVIRELKPLVDMLKGRKGKNGPFLEGQPGYADFQIVAFLAWFDRVDKSSWSAFVNMGNGELRALWDASLPWLDGQGEDKEWLVR